MASTYIYRTTGTPTLGTKCTVSFWWKNTEGKPSGGSDRVIFGTETTAASYIYLRNTGEFSIWQASTGTFDFRTKRLICDSTAWYHVCCTFDSTLATAADRVKIYINGVRETDFNASTAMAQDSTIRFNEASKVINIGGGFNQNMDGLLSHFHFIDGTAYDASTFGTTDATTGEWKIKTGPSVTYGNNGFFLKFEDSSNMDLDSSGNAHSFTTSGDLTPTEDNPSNNFPTFDKGSIIPNNSDNTFTNAGLGFECSAAVWHSEIAPFGFNKGKYYWEAKIVHNGGDPRMCLGTICEDNTNLSKSGNNSAFFSNGGAYSFHSGGSGSGDVYANGTNVSSSYDAITNFDNSNGQIVGFAIDCDNKRTYLSVGGTWQNSANPSNGTNPYDMSSGWTTGSFMFPFVTTHNSNVYFNFGNGRFGTTAVSSAGTNASGLGIFEYDVPTGFSALCTKGLNE